MEVMETALLLCLLQNSLSLSVTFREIPSFSVSRRILGRVSVSLVWIAALSLV